MRPSILEESDAAAAKVVPLTVDQYHRMIDAGILPEGEPIELIDGFLVRKDRSAIGDDPMTVGHAHRLAVTKILNPDVSCVIEVAETSLVYDRTTKQRVYADAGIPQFVLVNIPERQIEIYEEPSPEGRYASRRVLTSSQPVRIAVGSGRYLEIPADDLLP